MDLIDFYWKLDFVLLNMLIIVDGLLIETR